MATLSPRLSLRLFLLISLLSGIVSACSSVSSPSISQAPQASSAETAAAPIAATGANSPTEPTANLTTNSADLPRSQLQLVKTGTLTLTVDSVTQAIDQITAIARQQQGDLLQLQDQFPNRADDRHTALLQIRVPQQNLEPTLKALTQIGTVQQQTITAEDVSSQLVDHQARLRNLRKTETTLLDIMNRSGSVADVLKVAQELSQVRNSIEQVDAQLKSLQAQVAYSIVTINLQQTITPLSPQPQLQTQVQETWERATRSVGGFTVSLLKLGLWLIAYSPYWLVLGLVVWGIRRRRSGQGSGEWGVGSGE